MSDEFRAAYYAVLHQQALIALKYVCQQVPSVAVGQETVEDKIEMYLEEAKSSPELEEFLHSYKDLDPPQRLIDWLMQKVKEHNEKTQASEGSESNSEGK